MGASTYHPPPLPLTETRMIEETKKISDVVREYNHRTTTTLHSPPPYPQHTESNNFLLFCIKYVSNEIIMILVVHLMLLHGKGVMSDVATPRIGCVGGGGRCVNRYKPGAGPPFTPGGGKFTLFKTNETVFKGDGRIDRCAAAAATHRSAPTQSKY